MALQTLQVSLECLLTVFRREAATIEGRALYGLGLHRLVYFGSDRQPAGLDRRQIRTEGIEVGNPEHGHEAEDGYESESSD